MSDSAPRLSSLQLLRSSAVTVPPTAGTLRAMAIAPPSDSSFLFFLCRTIFPSFLMMPSSRNQPHYPPAHVVPLIQNETTATTSPISSPTPPNPTRRRRSSRLSSQSLVLTSLLWSLALICVADAQTCTKTNPVVGFRGAITNPQDLGTITVLDDCSFLHETNALVNNITLLGFNWIGQLRSGGVPLTIGVVATSPLTGADTAMTYRLKTGITWSDLDILAIADGTLVKAFVTLGLPSTTTTTTTTVPPVTTRTTTTTSAPQASGTAIITSPPPATATTTLSAPQTTPATGGSAVPTIIITDNSQDIVVTVGPNTHYPGLTPTQLNVSLWINGIESPVLVLTRGLLYHFSIQAGTSHPVYITSDINGGRSNLLEIIRAGNKNSFGTTSSPNLLPFFAPQKGQLDGLKDSDPLFYQCYVHRRMGWKITFQDSNTTTTPTYPDNGSSGANVATRGTMSLALVVVLLATFLVLL